MIIQLSAENIVEYWDSIRYALQQTISADEPIIKEQKLMEFTNKTLVSLLTEKMQAWVIMTEDRRPKMLMLTRIDKTISGQLFVRIELAYGYMASTEEEKRELALKSICVFARNAGADFLLAESSNPMAWRAMLQVGAKEKGRIFILSTKETS